MTRPRTVVLSGGFTGHSAARELSRLLGRRAEITLVNPTVQHFRDVHNHLLRVADRIESYDTLLTGVLQADLARVAVR